MRKPGLLTHQRTTAFGLGVVALALNMFSQYGLGFEVLHLGDLLLFAGAITLGPVSVGLAWLISYGTAIIFDSGLAAGMRLLILLMAVAVTAQRYRSIPAYLIVLAAWLLLLLPLQWALPSGSLLSLAPTTRDLLPLASADVLQALLAGALLLNPYLWGLLTREPRPFALRLLLLHVLPLMAMLGWLAAGLSGTSTLLFTVLLLTIIALSVAGAIVLNKTLLNNLQELFSAGILNKHPTLSFSGLSSEYWRRKNKSSTESQPSGERALSDGGAFDQKQGVCAIKADGSINFVNRRFYSILDLKEEDDVVGRQWENLTIGAEIKAGWLKLINGKQAAGVSTLEVRVGEYPEQPRFFALTAQTPEDIGSQTLGAGAESFILTIRDISHRRALEQHLLQGQRLVSLGNLVRGVGHSCNNALTTIAGLAGCALRTTTPERIPGYLKQIVDCCHTSGVWLRQLMEFAEEGPRGSILVDINQLIQSRLDLLQQLLADHTELIFNQADAPLLVRIDPNLAVQILTNLIVNAKEALPEEGGRIKISLATEQLQQDAPTLIANAQPGDYVRLRVEDNGCGMSPGVLARACDPLYTTKANYGNPGLGLSIVYGIIRTYDGFLNLESQAGKGTSVSVYFPLQSAEKEERAGSPTEKRSTAAAKPAQRVLVVEDEEDVREVICDMVRELGHTAQSCASGADALALLPLNSFDTAIIDYCLPNMTGTDLIEQMRQAGCQARIVIISGHSAEQAARQAQVDFLAKPFDIDQLQAFF